MVAPTIQPGMLIYDLTETINPTDLVDKLGFQDVYCVKNTQQFYPILYPNFLLERGQDYITNLPLPRTSVLENIALFSLYNQGEFWETLPHHVRFHHKEHPIWFIDGSFTTNITNPAGYAIVTEDTTTMVPVRGNKAQTGGPQYVETMAMRHAVDQAPPGTIIASDSTTALHMALSLPPVKNHTVQVMKVQAHAGVWGNEIADQCAKKARGLSVPIISSTRDFSPSIGGEK